MPKEKGDPWWTAQGEKMLRIIAKPETVSTQSEVSLSGDRSDELYQVELLHSCWRLTYRAEMPLREKA
jgi:hypothetical protein